MEKLGWFPFYPRDWYADPKLAPCAASSRGIWIDLLSAMFIEGEPSITGDRFALASIARSDEEDVDQFISDCNRYKFADVTECDGAYTITCRRFAREQEKRAKSRKKVADWRAAKGADSDGNSNVTDQLPGIETDCNGYRQSQSQRQSQRQSQNNTNLVDDEVSVPELLESWNDICPALGLSAVRELSASRKQKAASRLREHPKVAFWNDVFREIRGSPFLLGQGPPNGKAPWRANFDWLIDNDTNCIKVAEGRYGKSQ